MVIASGLLREGGMKKPDPSLRFISADKLAIRRLLELARENDTLREKITRLEERSR